MPATVFTSNDVRSYVALGPQTAAGTPATTYTFSKWLDGSGIDHDRAVTVEREGGDGQDMNLAYVEHHFGGAQANQYLRPDIGLKIVAWALGQSSVVATSPVFQHEVIPQPDGRIVTYEQYAPGVAIGERMIDSQITELVVTHELGKPLRVNAQVVGGNTPEARVAASARTVAVEAEPPFMFHQGSIQIAIAGAAVADDTITGWTLTFTRNVDDAVQGVGLGRQGIPNLNREVSLEVTRRFTDPAAHQAVHYAGGSVGAATVATGAFRANYAYNMQAANASNRVAEFEVPQFVVQGITRNTFEPDGQTVYETITAMAIKGPTHIARAMFKGPVATHVASGAL